MQIYHGCTLMNTEGPGVNRFIKILFSLKTHIRHRKISSLLKVLPVCSQ